MKRITNRIFDEERALYHLVDAEVSGCTFDGPQDGESALKECRKIAVHDCRFALRYPLWHAHEFTLSHSVLAPGTRAPLWYGRDGRIVGCTIEGVKALRECEGIALEGCTVRSSEFAWKCRGLSFRDMQVDSEYFLLMSRDVRIDSLQMTGKYSFQYVEDMQIENSKLDTKDAFWHSRRVTVRNSLLKGEYLGWYSEGLTLINCEIAGTQPLCYCRNLRLINCRMNGCDLAFEYSDVNAEIVGSIDSVKNPASGRISADRIGEVILSDSVVPCNAQIIERATEKDCAK